MKLQSLQILLQNKLGHCLQTELPDMLTLGAIMTAPEDSSQREYTTVPQTKTDYAKQRVIMPDINSQALNTVCLLINYIIDAN